MLEEGNVVKMKSIDEHNKEQMGSLNSAGVKCKCGGELFYMADRKTRNLPGRVAELCLCKKCNRTSTKYVFVK